MSSSKAMSADGEVDPLGSRASVSRFPLETVPPSIPPERGVQAPGSPWCAPSLCLAVTPLP